MGYLRRFRPLLAGLALLLSPGVLAPWIQLAHACPTIPPAQAQAGTEAHAHHGSAHDAGHQADTNAPAHDLHTCICIGACQTVALQLVRSATVPVAVVVMASAPGFRSVPAAAFPHHPELHPPATAPPVST